LEIKEASSGKRVMLRITPLLIVIFLAGYIAGNFLPLSTVSNSSGLSATPSRVQIPLDDDLSYGDKDAPVVLIEFVDYQCPFCRRFYAETLRALEDEYINTGKVLFVVKDFPIDSIHASAQKASEAVECANDQGLWRELHDKIFEEQNKLGSLTIQFTIEDLKNWAYELGIDRENFDSCLDSGKYAEEVQKDFEDGENVGITGTPYFFIGNPESGYVSIVGAQPYSVFKQVIESELENK
jgi:protein-disulfide isomerase